jgi:AraC-like DNA-binding protein
VTFHGAGQICVWDGGSVWIGRAAAPNAVHSHHAVQVALALEGRFRFQSPEDGIWLDCASAVIASNQPHAFDGRNAPALAHLFVEPVSLAGRVLSRRFAGPNGIFVSDGPPMDTAAERLAACYRASRQPADLMRAAREVIELLTDGVEVPQPADRRILLASDYLNANLGEPVALSQIAAVVHLSPSRFRHLFVAEMGLAFRPYVLWLRLKRAVEAFAAGETLTTAAYLAGFADSAHLSRTFRRMYGLSASSLALD